MTGVQTCALPIYMGRSLKNIRDYISTHTLTWSVTVCRRKITGKHQNFNSHAHVERDTSVGFIQLVDLEFQLTRSREAWRDDHWLYHRYVEFQLTRSRGAWQERSDTERYPANFNSHAHVERDDFSSLDRLSASEFQLTRSRGAWRIDIDNFEKRLKISTHTLTWSVTICYIT